ncbi:unnamed protein product [Effrenium voratum]|nr:unnamed protein product [Effrenium voratum]
MPSGGDPGTASAKGKGKGSGYKENGEKERPSDEVLAAELCEAINGGATTQAEALFSRLDVELRKQDSLRLQCRATQEDAAAVAALPDCGSDSSGDERSGVRIQKKD